MAICVCYSLERDASITYDRVVTYLFITATNGLEASYSYICMIIVSN